MSFADWFWEALSPNGLFYSLEERKEKSCCLCACYLLFDLKRLPRRLRLSTTRLLKTKRSIILGDFWFEDFFLLVIDVIKPPGTYRTSVIILIAELALLQIFEVPFFFPCYQRSFVCCAGSSSRVSQVFVINFSDEHCMQVGKSNAIPSAKT